MKVFRQITANNVALAKYPFRKELAMEAYLMENGDILKLDDDDFSEPTVLDAEIALKKGRTNSDGRIDLLVQYGMDYLAIAELKINEINDETLEQLRGYLEQRHQIIEKYPEYWEEDGKTKEGEPKWVGILAGTSISPDLQKKLQEGYTIGEIPIAGMVIRRFRSDKSEIFVITDTYFKEKGKKDYSKFEFQGQKYNKGKLVHKVLKTFAEQNPTLTFVDFEQVFPKSIQGSSGVFTNQEEARKIFNETNRKRYYIKPEELIKLSDSIIASCNQWNPHNIKVFIDHVNGMNWNLKIT